MAIGLPLELRVEVYSDGDLPSGLAARIGEVLARRWPGAWDVTLPTHPSRDEPAEWRAVVGLTARETPEELHRALAGELLALDPTHPLHLRTRWASQESPNHQEVYEERWRPARR